MDAVVGTGELESILEAAGIAPPPAATPSPFNILAGNSHADARSGQESLAGTHKADAAASEEINFRPEGDLREQQGPFPPR